MYENGHFFWCMMLLIINAIVTDHDYIFLRNGISNGRFQVRSGMAPSCFLLVVISHTVARFLND